LKRFVFNFEIFFQIDLKAFRLKPWFEFEYSSQFWKSCIIEKSSKSLFKFILVCFSSNSVPMYLNPFILKPKIFLKFENSFCSPFTFRPASSLWPALFFHGTDPLCSAFRPKLAHPRRPPFFFLRLKWTHCRCRFTSPVALPTHL
jgi:hypothetical protein